MSDETKTAEKPATKPATNPAALPVAAASAPATTPEPPRAVIALTEGRFKICNSSESDVGNKFAATTQAGTPFEDVLRSEFWAHTASKMRVGDEITIHTDDMRYYGRLYVRGVNAPAPNKPSNRATVFCLEKHFMDPIAKANADQSHEVVFLGPHKKWCVRSLSDQKVVKEGCATQGDASTWLRSIAA